MTVRRALLPLAVVVGLCLAAASTAQAAPVSVLAPAPVSGFHPGLTVGFGVAVPVGRTHRARYPVRVRRTAGHWALREEHLWVPGALIGYDIHHHPVYTEGRWVVQQTRVWIPGRAYRTHTRHPVRPRGHVRVGYRFH